MRKAWVNGEESQVTSLLDRGLAYGDGLFETFLYEYGEIRLLDLHLARLQAGANQLRLHFALDVMQVELLNFIQEARAEGLLADSDKAIIKIILSRGAGGRGYLFPEDTTAAQRVILLFDHPAYPPRYRKEGIQVRLCETPVSVNAALAGIKHLNRLDNVLARNEWLNTDVQEGIMLDEQGSIIEGTMTNVFLVIDHALITPSLERAGVAGVMRAYLLNMAKKNKVTTRISEGIGIQQLYDAQEVFVCNSILGVWPVVKLESKHWPIGSFTRLAQSWIQDACSD